MNALNSTRNLVVGAGASGLSCLRYLAQQGLVPGVYVDSMNNKHKQSISAISAQIKLFDSSHTFEEVLENMDTLLVSPGVSLSHPLIDEARKQNKEIIGDVELFARLNTKPVIAVTGSNAKSTVVTMLHEAALLDGKQSVLAGNIGKPVLDGMRADADLYVLELSSFQLDTTHSLHSVVACILNVSPDHLDRYSSFEAYAKSKQAIYRLAEWVVFNRDDAYSKPDFDLEKTVTGKTISFGMDAPETGHYGLSDDSGELCLVFGKKTLVSVSALAKQSRVDIQNALAVFAIARAAGISDQAIIRMLGSFSGLPHRCEFVSEFRGVRWINDSKGTNVGATQAALRSFQNQNVILIAGGDAKGADVSELETEIEQCVKQLIVLGKDAEQFHQAFSGICSCMLVDTLEQAVALADQYAQSGDVVLLSPACSSLDMFSSYHERGEVFRAAVQKIAQLSPERGEA